MKICGEILLVWTVLSVLFVGEYTAIMHHTRRPEEDE
jgi:hypothetical protein